MLGCSKSLKSLWGIQLMTVMLKLCNEIKDTANAVKVAEMLIPSSYPAGSIAQLPSASTILNAWYWRIFLYARSVIPTSACCLEYQSRKFLFRLNYWKIMSCARPLYPKFAIGPNLLSSNQDLISLLTGGLLVVLYPCSFYLII